MPNHETEVTSTGTSTLSGDLGSGTSVKKLKTLKSESLLSVRGMRYKRTRLHVLPAASQTLTQDLHEIASNALSG